MSSTIARADWLTAALTRLREQWSFEGHAFQQRLLAGALTPGELQLFTGEHYHVLLGLQSAGRRAAALADGMLAEQLARYATAQEQSVELWCDFAAATGWRHSGWYFGQEPLAATVDCARVMSGDHGSLALHLATIWAFESATAELMPRHLEALTLGYGFDAEATRYHALAGEQSAHAALVAEGALTNLLPITSSSALIDHAELTYRSYLELLSGVDAFAEACC